MVGYDGMVSVVQQTRYSSMVQDSQQTLHGSAVQHGTYGAYGGGIDELFTGLNSIRIVTK